MNKIVVGFSRPKNGFQPFSWLIRLAYWSQFSHAYVRFELEKIDRNIVFQASGMNVNFISDINFNNKEFVFKEFTFPIDIGKKKELLQFAIDQLGKPYSIKGIFGMGLVRIGELLHIKIDNPFKYDQTQDFCSEMTAYIAENFAGIVIDQPVANLAPKDLYTILDKLPISDV